MRTLRRGVRNVARPANRSPSVEPRTVETVKTCAVPRPETKGSLDPPIAEFKSLKAERQRRIPVVTSPLRSLTRLIG